MLDRRESMLVGLAVLLALSPCGAQPPPKRAEMVEELKAIKGIWQTAKWGRPDAEGYQLQLGITERNEKMEGGVYLPVTFHVKKGKSQFAEDGIGVQVQVKEDGEKGKRWFEFPAGTAKVPKSPVKLYYRPEGGHLLLTLGEGPYKGEYKLRKLKAKKD